jgi:hypothetical protein
MKVSDRISHNTVLAAIELAELGDSIMPTPHIALELRRIADDLLNLGGAVRNNNWGELIRRQPRMFAVT